MRMIKVNIILLSVIPAFENSDRLDYDVKNMAIFSVYIIVKICVKSKKLKRLNTREFTK